MVRFLLLNLHKLIVNTEGQDLVEYALLIALVSLGAIAGINGVTSALGTVFTNISTSLT